MITANKLTTRLVTLCLYPSVTQRIMAAVMMALVALTAVTASAQHHILPQLKREQPDMEQIAREVTDRSGSYYYPRLMAEFERNDTLMKIDKYRRLYLGYMLQEDYNPYRPSTDHRDITPLTEARRALTHAECDTVIRHSRAALANNPFDLRHITLLIQALRDKGDINLAKIWQYKLNYLLMAIVSTGTGTDEEDAWYVIEPQHEYVLLNMMGYTVTDHEFIEPYYEKVSVRDRHGRDSGAFYFNLKTLLDEYYRKHPDEAEVD